MKIFALFSSLRWRWGLVLKKLPAHVLSALGTLWLLTDIASFFSQDAENWLRSQGWTFGIIGVVTALYWSLPKTSFKHILNNRDVWIEVRVADIFNVQGALVVPMNTTFDTDLNGLILRSPSVQGKFLREYYEGRVDHLDLDIDKAIAQAGYIAKEIIADKLGKKNRYAVGTVIQLWKRNKLFYLLALTHISVQGRATTTEEDFRVSLANLWYYISEHGDKSDVVIPVIGTGHARLSLRKEEVIRDIIHSFIASCAQKTYCGKLIIVIHPSDVSRYQIDLDDIDSFLQYSCKYAKFDLGKNQHIGTGTT